MRTTYAFLKKDYKYKKAVDGIAQLFLNLIKIQTKRFFVLKLAFLLMEFLKVCYTII